MNQIIYEIKIGKTSEEAFEAIHDYLLGYELQANCGHGNGKECYFCKRDDFLSAIRNWGLTEKWEHAKFIFIYNSNEAMESAKFEFENNIIFICSL